MFENVCFQNLAPVDNRSDQQKVDAMLEQFVNEREIHLAHNAEDELEARIATLREKGVRPNEGAYVSNLHDDGSDEEVDKITRKASKIPCIIKYVRIF